MPSRHIADIRQVEAKTGRKLDEWCELLEANGVGDRRDAVNFLLDESERTEARRVLLPTELIVRGSTGPPRPN